MWEQTMQTLKTTRVILASVSPRRQEIMKMMGIGVEVIPSLYDENLDHSAFTNYGLYVQEIAKYKVQEVYSRLKNDPVLPSLIIGADTLVVMDNTIYGKPKSKSQAFEILSSLANKEHTVYTGVCLKTPNTEMTFYDSTKVKFKDISKEQIQAYIETGEPMDKAGGYGPVGIGATFIEKIDGDIYTMMGLPVQLLKERMNEILSQK